MFKVHSSTEDFLAQDDRERVPLCIEALHRKCGIYTQPKIVTTLLDAIGWKSSADLSKAKLLEPAAGDGAFIVEAAKRLLSSARRWRKPLTFENLAGRIRAFELHPREAIRARTRLIAFLSDFGLSTSLSKALAIQWITIGDFLLTDLPHASFSHVAGNPPYIRWSKIPKSMRRKYERRLPARMTKGDLFLPFLDLSLDYLVRGGRLGFVCSDRWQYMAFADEFRTKRMPELAIERNHQLTAGNAYVRDVSVYPSLLVLRRKTRAAGKPKSKRRIGRTLRERGYVIRVGPALGCTSAYVLGSDDRLVETELLAPWLESTEIFEGAITWAGKRIITLHGNDGLLRDLQQFPRAFAHISSYRPQLVKRAIVRAGAVWYRPIDRVIASDWARPKLVVPGMARVPRVAVDRSGAVPSHGVYAIFAPDDDVETLYRLLGDGRLSRALEGIAPRVNGGYVRCYRRFLEQVLI